MLYTILFATLIYVNSGQIALPDCTTDGDCASLNGKGYETIIGVSAGETFVCSANFGYCTR